MFAFCGRIFRDMHALDGNCFIFQQERGGFNCYTESDSVLIHVTSVSLFLRHEVNLCHDLGREGYSNFWLFHSRRTKQIKTNYKSQSIYDSFTGYPGSNVITILSLSEGKSNRMSNLSFS